MNLAETYAKFIEQEQKERDQWRLFATDVGRCPRKAAYRMLDTPKDGQSQQSLINKAIMFDLAEHIERVLSMALDDAGALIDYQADVVDWKDRENWGGRIDIVATYPDVKRIIEVKTLHPHAFRYDMDYPAHRQQASVYHIYTGEHYGLEANPVIVYFDRGGSNTSVEQYITVDEDYTFYLMDELDDVRDEVQKHGEDGLPERASKVLKVRNAGNRLVYEPSSDCTYCDYQGICKPDMGTETWANRLSNNEPWSVTKKADSELMLKFANERIVLDLEDL